MTDTTTCNHDSDFVHDPCDAVNKEEKHEHPESFFSQLINSYEAKAIGAIGAGLAGLAMQAYFGGNQDFGHDHQHNGCAVCAGAYPYCVACGEIG